MGLSRLVRRLALVDNSVDAEAPTGTITAAANSDAIVTTDTLTLDDGVHAAKVFAHHRGTGLTTSKNSIDIGGVRSTGTVTAAANSDAIEPSDTLTIGDGVHAAKVFAHHRGTGLTTTKNSIDIGGVRATGTITVAADPSTIQVSDELVIDDGVNAAKTFTHHSVDGTTTTKNSIDIGGSPTGAQLAARIITAINLANQAQLLGVTAAIDGGNDRQVNLTNDLYSVDGNETITTTAAEYTVAGMSGGLDATGTQLAARIVVAVNLANQADECDVTAAVNGGNNRQVDLTNDLYSVDGNVAIATTAAEYTVVGMLNGLDATGAQLATRVAAAINAANEADELDITAAVNGGNNRQVDLTNDVASAAGNEAITTTAAEYTVVGMEGGVTPVDGAFTPFELRDAAHANHAQAVLRKLTLRVPATEVVKYAYTSDADPDSATGKYAEITGPDEGLAERTFEYEAEDDVHNLYLHADGVTVEVECEWQVRA